MNCINPITFFNANFHSLRKNNERQARLAFLSKPDSLSVVNEAAVFNSPLLIEYLVNNNPQLKGILKAYNLTLNTKALALLEHNHLPATKLIALGIAQFVPDKDVDYKVIAEAATLHDIGKIFIPEKILNKKGKLSSEEQQIMHLHPILGYELLKNTKTNPKTLHSIKFHHQRLDNSGYPECSGIQLDINTQIISLADKYSALTENRSYKKAISKEEALKIIAEDVKKGQVSSVLYDALLRYLGL